MIKRTIILFLILVTSSFIFGSDITKLIENENIIAQYSPNKKYIYVSNVNIDMPRPIIGSYTIDNVKIDSTTNGFWLLFSVEEKKVLYYDLEDLVLYQIIWDQKNDFFIKNWGTSIERRYEVYGLKKNSYLKFDFNHIANKNGIYYSINNNSFAVNFLLKSFEIGFDNPDKIGSGIYVYNNTSSSPIEIRPKNENNKLFIKSFNKELIYNEVSIDGEIIEEYVYTFNK